MGCVEPLAFALNLGQRSVALLAVAAVALYLASRTAADALAGTVDQRPTAGRLALGHWLPVAVLAVVAAATGQFAVAVGIVFATAVGCLSLGLGTLAAVAPRPVGAPSAARRTWPLLVPAALMSLLAGFYRTVRPWDAAALAVVAACVLAVWCDRPAVAVDGASDAAPDAVPVRRLPVPLRGLQLVVAVALAVIGAGLAVLGLTGSAAAAEAANPGLLTATVLAPLVVLPILGTAADLAARGPPAASQAASALVGVALLDACGGLPIVVAVAAARANLIDKLAANPDLLWGWHDWPRWLGVAAAVPPATLPAAPPSDVLFSFHVVPPVVPFPLAVWRVDVVVLLALSAALVPVALGRFALTRAQGVALIVGYAAYLFYALRLGVGNV